MSNTTTIEKTQGNLDAKQWKEILIEQGEAIRHNEWEFVIRLVECHEALGEEFYGVLERVAIAIRRDERTLANYESCARRAIMSKPSWLRKTLTVGHHMSVDYEDLTTDDKRGLLKWAEENPGTTCAELRARAKEVIAAKRGEPSPSAGGSPEGPDTQLAFDGTVSFEGTVTISPNGNGYGLVFDSEEVRFKCHVPKIERA